MPPPSTSRASTVKRVARRLFKPILAPLDGRIADVNRRIESTRMTIDRRATALEHAGLHARHALAAYADSVAAYARAAEETTSFLGVALRRTDEAVRACADSAAAAVVAAQRAADTAEASSESGYRARLAHAAELPLERLDGALADLINRANGHGGFAAQAGLWFMPPVLAQLGAGEAHLSLVNERIVEVPFAMGALTRLDPSARILDIGRRRAPSRSRRPRSGTG